MTEKEYWIEVEKKFNELKIDFQRRKERSTDTEFIADTVLSEIRQLGNLQITVLEMIHKDTQFMMEGG